MGVILLFHFALLCPLSAKDPGAAIFEKSCVACHGPNARGNPDLEAPPLAGLPAWYTLSQLTRYAQGIRGAHPEDAAGLKMAAIAKLLSPEERTRLSLHISRLPVAPHPGPPGNPVHGKELFLERCAECHRFNASGEVTFGSAPLARFPAWYLHLQFAKFGSGLRAYRPDDHLGAKMKEISALPVSVDDLEDIFSYINSCN